MEIRFREIDDMMAQAMITNYRTDNLYFMTKQLRKREYTGGFQPRKSKLTDPIKYGSKIRKCAIFNVEATPKNVVEKNHSYNGHVWLLKEMYGDYSIKKPPIIKY